MSKEKIETRNRVALSDQDVSLAKEKALNAGIYYIVPPSKYGFYGDGAKPIVIPLNSEQAQYLHAFLNPDRPDSPEIWADLETALPFVVNRSEIGLAKIQDVEEDLIALVTIPQILLTSQHFLDLLAKNVSDSDMDRLEFELFEPGRNYLTAASLLRADLLFDKQEGRVFSCDPNLVPLGYSIVDNISTNIQNQTGLPVGPRPDYLEGIHHSLTKHPDKISGIVTGLNYPNWNSHASLAKHIRDCYKDPFYMVPTECLNQDGTIDIEKLNKFNRTFGIEEVPENVSGVPGLLIRYSREAANFHPETEVVNAPGIRMIETQLWGGVVALPGFVQIAEQLGIEPETVQKAKEIVVPTLIGRVVGGEIEIATDISQSDDGQIDFEWSKLEQRNDLLTKALQDTHNREKANEIAWYIKTLSTSGKKGVRFTNDGRIDQAERNILKITEKMGLQEAKLFLIQPKIRSTIDNPMGEGELRVKIDLFLSLNSGKTVLVDYMATPISQRSAHGSSSTRTGLVML